jgi:hypothetical protein
MKNEPPRIGCFAAFRGDTKAAIGDILAGAEVAQGMTGVFAGRPRVARRRAPDLNPRS